MTTTNGNIFAFFQLQVHEPQTDDKEVRQFLALHRKCTCTSNTANYCTIEF